MYKEKTEKNIKKDLLSRIKNTLDKSENSFIHDSVAPVAIELANAYIAIESVDRKRDIENLQDEELDIYIGQRTALYRKEEVSATGVVRFTGAPGSIIRVGNIVSAGEILYYSLEDKAIGASGYIDVYVECEKPGAIGNVPPGAVNNIPVSISGISGVTNQEYMTGGYDLESDDELRNRYYERVRMPITSGNKHHYRSWAKEITGVGNVKVYPLWAGNNTVKVMIIDSNNRPASAELVEEVQEYIDPRSTGLGEGMAPIGARCTVVSANAKEINVSANITRHANYGLVDIADRAKVKIDEYLRGTAFKSDLISHAKVGALLLEVDGILDYTDLTLNGLPANVTIGEEEIATIGMVTLNE